MDDLAKEGLLFEVECDCLASHFTQVKLKGKTGSSIISFFKGFCSVLEMSRTRVSLSPHLCFFGFGFIHSHPLDGDPSEGRYNRTVRNVVGGVNLRIL